MKRRHGVMIGIGILAVHLLAGSASAWYSPSTGRFLNRDPIHEPGHVLLKTMRQAQTQFIPRDRLSGKDGMNPSTFVINNPINHIDPLGLRVAAPPPGMPHCKLNNALVTLTFDGSRISANALDFWGAVSGKPVGVRSPWEAIPDTNDRVLTRSYEFDYSAQRQMIVDTGPIPAGGYWFALASENNASNRWAHWLELSGWGKYSWPLTIWPTTVSYGSDGFYLHGGSTPGSAGCIDVMDEDASVKAFLDKVEKANKTCKCYINVNVNYPRNNVVFDLEKIYRSWF